jgi:SAM-dependent methyltransferase
MTVDALNNAFLTDDRTLKRRSDTLHFGPAIDLISRLAAEKNRPVKVLDCGCSSGHFARMLELNGIPVQYTVLDYSLSFLAAGREFYGLPRLVQGDIRHLPFQAQSFDAVLAYGLVFMFDYMPAVIRELFRMAPMILLNLYLAPLGSNSLRMRLESGDQYMWLENFEHCYESFALAGLPPPDLALHWEQPLESGSNEYVFQGLPYRFQALFVWNERA